MPERNTGLCTPAGTKIIWRRLRKNKTMPNKFDNIPIKCPFLDKRTKILPCQRWMVGFMHSQNCSINSIARFYGVNKRLIQFILFPDRKKKNIEYREKRGGSVAYYKKEKQREYMRTHRKNKRKLYDAGLIGK